MKPFVSKLLHFSLFGIIPILALLLSYLYFDPFKVIRDYDDYSNPYVIPNRDNISTRMFLHKFGTHRYNSFILGSSRTLAFRPNSWRKHLSPEDAPFMFDASAESIYGIYKKLVFLDAKNVAIKNALIILCRDATFNTSENHKEHLFIKDPATSGESKMVFQFAFLKAYFTPKFLVSFFGYQLFGEYKSYMDGYIEDRKITFDTVTNEINIRDQEMEITRNPKKYYALRAGLFYERTHERTDSVQRINKGHQHMLNEIRRILDKHNTNYNIVLSPLYEQIKFHPKDLSFLTSLFGPHLFDFSGKNRFTENRFNYYETSHFRPHVGDSIFNIMYEQ